MIKQERLISHTVSPEALDVVVEKITKRLQESGESSSDIKYKLELLDQLTEFDFGRYLLINQGLNGYWTHYMLTHPWFGQKTEKNNSGKPLTTLERFMLERSPLLLATQQRFEIFLKENQQQVKNNHVLACIPCGMMGELLYLDFNNIDSISLVGVDYDDATLKDSNVLAEKQKLSPFVKLMQEDAWQLSFENEFDLISSNGLSIYEPDDKKVEELYVQFYKALKNGGKLVTSFLTYPPTLTEHCEWDMSKIFQDDLLLQKTIFVDIIGAKWQCFRTSVQTKVQLEEVGFKDVQFIYDDAKIFPTVIAYK